LCCCPTYTCLAEDEGNSPSTPYGDRICLWPEHEGETPSTPCGDNTRLIAEKSFLVPLSYVTNTGTPTVSVSWTFSYPEGPPSSCGTDEKTCGPLNIS